MIVYAALLAVQTLAVGLLLWILFPIFYSVVTHLGEQQDIRPSGSSACWQARFYFKHAIGRGFAG
jgi:uncharacterized membrane protein YjfL (UPF0719 family)